MRLPPAKRHRLSSAFGAVLRVAREQRGLSQEDLADAVDLSRTMPSLYERGLRSPTLIVLFEIARALDIEPTQLVADTMARLQGTTL